MQTNATINHGSIDKLFSMVEAERPTIEKEIVIEEEPLIIEETTTTAKPSSVNEIVEKVTNESAETTADTFIWLIDFVQQLVFKFFANKKKKNRAKKIAGVDGSTRLIELLEQLKKERRNKTTPTEISSEEDRLLLELNDEINDFIEALDLTDSEKKMLKEPLKEMAKIKNMKISPEMSLFIAAAMIVCSRVGVLISI